MWQLLVFVKSLKQQDGIKDKQEGNVDPALKLDFYMFSLIFKHRWTFLSTMQTLPFEGHNVAYQCKGLDQSNLVCEFEVNRSTNEKFITEKQNFNIIC